MVVGAVQVINGNLEIGVLAAFLLYVRRMYDPLDELAMFYNTYQSAAAALEKISGLLEEVPAVPEPADPVPLAGGGAIAGDVRFDGVAFSYHPRRAGAARAGSAHPGRPDRRVGRRHRRREVDAWPSCWPGSTTRPPAGCCWTAPTSRRSSTADLRRGVVMVTQESFLFSGIGRGQHRARPAVGDPRRRSRQAADAIGAGDFIRALPEGFDTDVRKRGGRLSAGQRQLVAFARAFLADPAVLILDEATASLDIPAERAVQRALLTVLQRADRGDHRAPAVDRRDRRPGAGDGARAGSSRTARPSDLIGGSGAYASLHAAWRESLV